MSVDFGDWTDEPEVAGRRLREQRSGLSGFGGRPALHPAWRAPLESDGGRGSRPRDSSQLPSAHR